MAEVGVCEDVIAREIAVDNGVLALVEPDQRSYAVLLFNTTDPLQSNPFDRYYPHGRPEAISLQGTSLQVVEEAVPAPAPEPR